MPDYIASWSVFVLGQDDPISAARVARQMADEHHRSLWGLEECGTGDTVTVDVRRGEIIPIKDLEELELDEEVA